MAQTEQQPASLATARILALGLIMGPCLLWLTGWFQVGRRGPIAQLVPATAILLIEIWAAIACASLICSWIFRGRAMAVVERAPRITESAEANRALSDLQTWLVVAWAMVEAPAIFSGVLFLMTGGPRVALAGVLVLFIGMLRSFPRAAWFEPLQRIRDGT